MTRRRTALFFVVSGALMVATACGGSSDSSDSAADPAVELVGPDATAELARLGYSDVTDLAGGMVAWEEAGRTIDIVLEHRNVAALEG